jgi:hypothetical protein
MGTKIDSMTEGASLYDVAQTDMGRSGAISPFC